MGKMFASGCIDYFKYKCMLIFGANTLTKLENILRICHWPYTLQVPGKNWKKYNGKKEAKMKTNL